MNATIAVSGAHASIAIHDYFSFSSEVKNKILDIIHSEDNESLDCINNGGFVTISGEVSELKELFELLWDLM